MAFRVLRLEQQIESYQQLHAQELEEIRRALLEVKEQVLAMTSEAAPANQPPAQGRAEPPA